jgi:hypothetical protein
LVCTAGAALFTCAQPLLLPSPSEGLARWLKSRSTFQNTKGAHPNSHLIRVHRASIETQKVAQNRLKNRLKKREAFCSLGSSVFFKVQQTVHSTKQRFIQDNLLFLTACVTTVHPCISFLVLLVNDSEYSKSKGAKPIFISLLAVFISFPWRAARPDPANQYFFVSAI